MSSESKYSLFLILIFFISSCIKSEDSYPEDRPEGDDTFIQVLGRPTSSSISASLLFDQGSEFYLEYGRTQDNQKLLTGKFIASENIPLKTDLQGLSANSEYKYRVIYRQNGSSDPFISGTEHSFNTQRSPGTEFTFTIESDEHLYDKKGVKSIYQICLNNQAEDNPDFMISLGDIFGDDRNGNNISNSQIKMLHEQYLPFLGSLCHSVPFFICLGNHEGENNFLMAQNPPNNLAINGTQWRKYYYPNPYPDGFYSGNAEIENYGIGNPENYYSWTWGDALFVVLDAYRYQSEQTSKPAGWDWTLGSAQYHWLEKTLVSSNSKYKFVFAHHIRGEGRGGIINARFYEWGGYDSDGVTYSFPSRRPGWRKPVHQLFIENKVNIFFQGHDHVFAHEVLDGITYQSVPMPSDSTYQIGILANGDQYLSDVVAGTGHLKVSVSSSSVTVDFIRAVLPADESGSIRNGTVAFSYTIN